MKLVRIVTQGIRGLPDREFSFTHPGTGAPLDVVLVTGGPASGKTRLLEAIVAVQNEVGAIAVRPSAASSGRDEESASIHATWLLSPAEQVRAGVDEALVTTTSVLGTGGSIAHSGRPAALLRPDARAAEGWRIEYFSAGRHLPTDTREVARGGEVDARARIARGSGMYDGFRAFLVEALLDDALELAARVRVDGVALRADGGDALADLRELLRPFLHGKVLDGIDPVRGGYRVRFRCRDGAAVDLDELSAAEQQGVLFAVTFRRLGLDHALVLVDTPELHLHPSVHADFFARVVALGQDTQIIAATSSAELLHCTPREQVLAL